MNAIDDGVFANKCSRTSWFALFVFIAYFAILIFFPKLLTGTHVVKIANWITLIPAAIFLVLMFLAHQFWMSRREPPKIVSFVGDFSWKNFLGWAAVILALYIVSNLIAVALHVPREPFMAKAFMSLTPLQECFLLAFIMIFAPLTEEFAFRHFLMSFLLFQKNKCFLVAAVIISTFVFWFFHGYIYLPAKATIALMGVILAAARVKSRGLLLPMLLHSYSEVLGTLADWLRTSLGV